MALTTEQRELYQRTLRTMTELVEELREESDDALVDLAHRIDGDREFVRIAFSGGTEPRRPFAWLYRAAQ